MSNIAAALRSEIARVARKEIRTEVEALRKSLGTARRQIVELKRQLEDQHKQLRGLQKATQAARGQHPPEPQEGDGKLRRFSPARLAAHRQRLGLSAADFGKLIGASTQSIYNWETGTARPRADALEAIAQLRGMGKRAVMARLAELRQ